MNKHWQYLKYVLRHKWYVAVECFKHGLYWQGIVHDMSKFLPSEWFPYVDKFYGSKPDGVPDDIRTAFSIAWLKHMHRNPHHPQHWATTLSVGVVCSEGKATVFDMPKRYYVEMVCDWLGAGKAQGKFSPSHDPYKECRGWYIPKAADIKMTMRTRLAVEEIMGMTED